MDGEVLEVMRPLVRGSGERGRPAQRDRTAMAVRMYNAGATMAEVAAALGCSEDAAYQRLLRARRAALAAAGPADPAPLVEARRQRRPGVEVK